MGQRILTINTGSSSLKATRYDLAGTELHNLASAGTGRVALTASAERLGTPESALRIQDADGTLIYTHRGTLPDHAAALQALLAWLREHDGAGGTNLDAIGHRIVHGGSNYVTPQRIDDALIATLRELVPLDPAHLPQAIAAIAAASQAYPAVPQVACFDTAFHRTMPRVAQIYALPRDLTQAGVVRYGFHGLSYESILAQLQAHDPTAADGRVVIAHLGNGASMAAVRHGHSVDTTMGFTPTGGLVMGTRTGDLDPGVLVYLLRAHGLDAEGLSRLVTREAGLLGVSGTSADMRDLLARERDDPHATEAVALFCYQARKFLGALAATLGGLETLVFTGGIGEHAAPVRARICADFAFLGLTLDAARNREHAPVISRAGAPVTVRVMHTDEDLVIARHTQRLLAAAAAE